MYELFNEFVSILFNLFFNRKTFSPSQAKYDQNLFEIIACEQSTRLFLNSPHYVIEKVNYFFRLFWVKAIECYNVSNSLLILVAEVFFVGLFIKVI